MCVRAPAPRPETGGSIDHPPPADGPGVFSLQPVYFDHGSSAIRPEMRPVLMGNARWIRATGATVVVEGYCAENETESEEVSVALGAQRAAAVERHLIDLGVPARQIRTVSFGELRPAVMGHDESSWRYSRRASFGVVDYGAAAEASPPGDAESARAADVETEPPAEPIGPTVLSWNAWAEEPRTLGFLLSSPSYETSKTLSLDEDYRIHVTLADLMFDDFDEDVVSHPADDSAEGTLAVLEASIEQVEREAQKPLEELDPEDREIVLTVLLLPDPTYFTLKDESRIQKVHLDLLDVKELLEDPPPRPEDLRDADKFHSLFRKTFEVHTRAEGQGAIALAVWSPMGPLDEFVFGFCIGDPEEAGCGPPSSLSNGLAGLDSRRSSYGASVPDGALHFIEMPRQDDSYLAVLFWRASEPDLYLHWEVDESVASLRHWLAEYFQSQLDDAVDWPDERTLRNAGVDLFAKLFPAAGAEREAFISWVQTSSAMESSSAEAAPSLFVRVIGLNSREPVWLPMGFLGLPEVAASAPATTAPEAAGAAAADSAASAPEPASEGGTAPEARPPEPSPPLGLRLRVEMPLQRQIYYTGSECLASWHIVTPPTDSNDEELDAAAAAMDDFDRWEGDDVVRYREMREFDDLLRSPYSIPPSGIVITSHHDKKSLYFVLNDKLSPGAAGYSDFSEPSVLLLNGCGTTTARSTEFVEAFNAKGISAVIATHTEISGVVAGHFLDCFAEQVGDTSQAETISDAYLGAVKCLSGRLDHRAETIGARALTYTLLGDGSVPLCPPVTEPSDEPNPPPNPVFDPRDY